MDVREKLVELLQNAKAATLRQKRLNGKNKKED